MPNKKLIALIVLTILAVISLAHGIMAPAKGRARTSSVSPGAGQELGMPKGIISTERRARRSQFREWKRSPFAPSGTVSTELVLNGIIWNKARPKAMIGDAIVMKGDRVGENTVVDIKADRVILSDGAKETVLKLEK
jgi:hypothetical protein